MFLAGTSRFLREVGACGNANAKHPNRENIVVRGVCIDQVISECCPMACSELILQSEQDFMCLQIKARFAFHFAQGAIAAPESFTASGFAHVDKAV